MTDGIVGVLLAAGTSRRFGSDKRLARLSDGTPLAVAAAQKLRAVCARTLVVVRADDASSLVFEGCEIIRSDDAWRGMGHSLAAAVAASPHAGGWLVALADMPYIEPASYRNVIAALHAGASIAQPVHNGKPGHPVGFAAHWYAQLIALVGDSGARALVQQAKVERVLCHVNDAGIHRDVDTSDDLVS
jgi:molybdenum cofactor cytidylyltransferase